MQKRRIIWIVITSAHASLALVGSLTAQTTCPSGSDHPEAREVVQTFLTHEGFAEDRQAAGLPPLDVTHLRLLTDASDRTTCQVLRSRVTVPAYFQSPWFFVIYEIDGYYFMAFFRGPIEETRIRVENGKLYGMLYPIPLGVFDRSLNQLLDLQI